MSKVVTTMSINWGLKSSLVERFGSQVEAARQMGVRENRLSYIVRRHVQPTDRDRQALEQALGRGVFRRLLNGQMG